ncbi:socius isoform 2-like protein [Anopheles sinensis]|uniref:Socius isoform 2-like protein n=1 Tax=Anopheles sinensis TaxID=74873 RepID=A0A084W3Q0_ANOSI|nr:socius isoform 2-like protein [Anopheles sinensis]
MAKVDILQASLQNIEHNMKPREGCSQDRKIDTLERALTELQQHVKEREESLERKLIDLENNITAKDNTLLEVNLSIKVRCMNLQTDIDIFEE